MPTNKVSTLDSLKFPWRKWSPEIEEAANESAFNKLKENTTENKSDRPLSKPKKSTEIVKLCLTPNDFFGSDRKRTAKENIIKDGDTDPDKKLDSIASGFGLLVEAYIALNLIGYFKIKNVSPLDIYYDDSVAGSKDLALVGFLRRKNAHVSDEAISQLGKSYLKRPDILIDSKLVKAYYEIKPDSDSGRYKGRIKIQKISAYMDRYEFPYTIGKDLGIDEIEVGNTALSTQGRSIPIGLTLSLKCVNGVILYKLCIETDWEFIISNQKTFELLKTIYLPIAEEIVRTPPKESEKKNAVNEQIDRLIERISKIPVADLPKLEIGLIFVIVVLGIIEFIPASLLLLLAGGLAVSQNSLETVVSEKLVFRNTKNTTIG